MLVGTACKAIEHYRHGIPFFRSRSKSEPVTGHQQRQPNQSETTTCDRKGRETRRRDEFGMNHKPVGEPEGQELAELVPRP